MKHKIIIFSFLVAALFAVLCTSCKTNSSGFPIIWFMHNGTPVQKVKKVDVEVGPTNKQSPTIKSEYK